MKYTSVIAIVVFVICFVSCGKVERKMSQARYQVVYDYQQSDSLPPFSVLELFTTESCSDCPPAQLDFKKIIEEYEKENVICISQHVDYWNNLIWGEGACRGNWIDKYSEGYYTARQFAYANKFGEIAGTPQVVINGKEIISDPRFDNYRQSIEKHHQLPVYGIKLHMNGDLVDLSSNSLDVLYSVSTDTTLLANNKIRAQLMLFLVEKNLITVPSLAENCGTTIYNENIARSWNSVTLRGITRGRLSLQVPLDVNLENCRVVAMVQNLFNLDVLGGTTGFTFTKEK